MPELIPEHGGFKATVITPANPGQAARPMGQDRRGSVPVDDCAMRTTLRRLPLRRLIASRPRSVAAHRRAALAGDLRSPSRRCRVDAQRAGAVRRLAVPLRGISPKTGKPFLDVERGRAARPHTARGGVLWEDATYSDRRVLLSIPRGFDLRKPSLIVVFFHGNGATLTRDVRNRQQVPRQIVESGLNAVLVAPQFAVDAADSSAGRFWEPGVFAQFMSEAAGQLARLHGDARARAVFERAPIVIAAYSGGYHPLAFVLRSAAPPSACAARSCSTRSTATTTNISTGSARRPEAFFVSTYGPLVKPQNEEFQQAAHRARHRLHHQLPAAPGAGDQCLPRRRRRGEAQRFRDPGLVGRPAQGDAVARAGLCAALSAHPIAPRPLRTVAGIR